MAEQIPNKWKKAVLAILAEGLGERVEVTVRARQDFEDLFPDTFGYHLIEAFTEALQIPELEGNRKYGMKPEGEIYEFIFDYRKLPVYGKVCLRKDGKLVLIISAHRPLKGNAL